jgi:1,4-alpha-glucan branching enzyme
MKYCVQTLNALYRAHPALYELQYEEGGFEWVELNQRQEGIIAFKRKGKDSEQAILVVFNMTPVPRHQFPIRVQGKTIWKEIFNSDDHAFWGSGDVKNQNIQCGSVDGANQLQEIHLELPPLAAIVLK